MCSLLLGSLSLSLFVTFVDPNAVKQFVGLGQPSEKCNSQEAMVSSSMENQTNAVSMSNSATNALVNGAASKPQLASRSSR